MSASSTGSPAKRGGGGGGKKPPQGGRGGHAAPGASPVKPRRVSPWENAQRLLLPFLNDPMDGALAHHIAEALATAIINGLTLPPFLHDIGAAHARVRQLNVVPSTEPYYIGSNTLWHDQAPRFFYYLYRTRRAGIADDPSSLSTLSEQQRYHQAVLDLSRQSRGSIGAYGPLIQGFLLAMTNSALRYNTRGDPDHVDARCNACQHRSAPCVQSTAVDGSLNLLGSCTECWANSRKNCSFLAARRAASTLPTPTKADNYESGRATARTFLDTDESLFTSHSRFPDDHFGASRQESQKTLEEEMASLSHQERQDKISSARDVSHLVRPKDPSGPRASPVRTSLRARLEAAAASRRSQVSNSPPSRSSSFQIAPPSNDERAVGALAAQAGRQLDADISLDYEDMDVDEPFRAPSNSPSLASGGLGQFMRSASFSPTTRAASARGPASISSGGSPSIFEDAVESFSSPRRSLPGSPPRPNEPQGHRRQSSSLGQVMTSNSPTGSLRSPTGAQSPRTPPGKDDRSWLPSKHHYHGPGDAPRKPGGRGGRGGSAGAV